MQVDKVSQEMHRLPMNHNKEYVAYSTESNQSYHISRLDDIERNVHCRKMEEMEDIQCWLDLNHHCEVKLMNF